MRKLYQIWKADKTRKFQRALLAWFDENKRDLPWRRNADPYRVWISEIMLQQTQAQTVLPYFERFLRRFPSIAALARASEDEVVAEWAGLGYYGRARNLSAAAKIVAERHGSRFPDRLENVASLPGIGRYTAGAILSIAFNRPHPVVDGNVRRVISRLHGILLGAPEKFFWTQAEAWIPGRKASDFNQAVMELGALICTPAAPRCRICPAGKLCAARREGIQERIPPPRIVRKAQAVRLVMLVLEHDGRLLLVRDRAARYIPGEWGFPTREVKNSESSAHIGTNLAKKITGRKVSIAARASVSHGITYRRMSIEVFTGKIGDKIFLRNLDGSARWVPRSQAVRYLTSSVFLKALAAALPPK